MTDLILRVYYDGQWQDLDVDSNIPLRLDISAVENTDIGAIYGVGSQQFQLPGTRRNNAFFKGAYKVGATNVPAFYSIIDCEVLYGGELLIQGSLQLDQVITDDNEFIEYTVTVTDQSVQFITQLQDKLIRNANWSDLNHELSAASITGSWNGTLAGGAIFYPLADYGNNNPDQFPTIPRIQVGGSVGCIDNITSSMALQQFLPAVEVRTLIDKIADQVGFKITSSLLNSPAFDDLYYLPKGQNELGPVVTGNNGTLEASFGATEQTWGPIISGQLDSTTVVYENVITQSGVNYDSASGVYTIGVDGFYNFTANLTVDNPSNVFNGAQLAFGVFKNVTGVGGDYIDYNEFYYAPSSGYSPIGQLPTSLTTTFEGPLNAGDEIDIRLTLFPPTGSFNNTYPIFTTASAADNAFATLGQSAQNQIWTGTTVSMGQQFDSQAKSIDILKGILTQFNAVAVPEPNSSKVIRIENFDTYMAQGVDVDWTERYASSVRKSIKHPISEQSKQIILQNADDSDRFSVLSKDNDPNYQYGTIRVISDSTVALGEQTIETYHAPVVIAPIIQSGSFDSDNNPTFNLSNTGFVLPHLYKFDNNKQTTYLFKPRLGYKSNLLAPYGAVNGIYIDGQQVFQYRTLSNLSQLPATAGTYDLHFDNQYFDLLPIGFGANAGTTAYQNYWEQYVNNLYWDEARKVTLDLEFSPTEYKNIHLNDRIFIGGEQYRINKISGFNLQQNDVVAVELLKQQTQFALAIDCTLVVSGVASNVITPVPSNTPTPTPTGTATPTPTASPTPSATATATPTPSPTPDCFMIIDGEVFTGATPTPTATATPTPTPAGQTATPTPTPTNTPIGFTPTPTATPTVTPTAPSSVFSFGITTDGFETFTEACAGIIGSKVYTNAFTDINDAFFGNDLWTDTLLTVPFSGGGLFYGMSNNTPAGSPVTNYIRYIDGTGIVSEAPCAAPTGTPTATPTATPVPTPTPIAQLWGTSMGASAQSVCGFSNTPTAYYSPDFIDVNNLSLNDRIYSDAGYSTELPTGYYGLNNRTTSPVAPVIWIRYELGVGITSTDACGSYPTATPATPTPTPTQTPTQTPIAQLWGTSIGASAQSVCNLSNTPNAYYSPDFIDVNNLSLLDSVYTDAGYTTELATGYYGVNNRTTSPVQPTVWFRYETGVGITSTDVCGSYPTATPATPTPTATGTPTPTPTATPTATPTPTPQIGDFFLSNSGYGSAALACSLGSPQTAKFAYEGLGIGDVVYNDITLLDPFAGGNLWWAFDVTQGDPNPSNSLQIDNNGVVQDIGTCAQPTPTPSATPTATPTPTPTSAFTTLYSTAEPDSGAANAGDACGGITRDFYPLVYVSSTITNVSQLNIGDFVYSDTNLTTGYNGNAKWYGLDTSASAFPSISFEISATGEITNKATC